MSLQIALQEKNLQHVIHQIYEQYKLSAKSRHSCYQIIRKYMQYYVQALEATHTVYSEELLKSLNARCISDFDVYLQQKYPQKNLKKQIYDEILTRAQKNDYLIRVTNPQLSTLVQSEMPSYDKILSFSELLTYLKPVTTLDSPTKNTYIKVTLNNITQVHARLKEIIQAQAEATLEVYDTLEQEKQYIIQQVEQLKSNLIAKEVPINDDELIIEINPHEKNYVLSIPSSARWTEIKLVAYHLFMHDITFPQFESRVIVCHEQQNSIVKLKSIIYDEITLLHTLNEGIEYLEWCIHDNLLQVKHRQNKPFDLILANENAFHILGFHLPGDMYQRKSEYIASQPIQWHAQQICQFYLSGTNVEEFALHLNEAQTLNKVLKVSTSALPGKDFPIQLTHALNNKYDFNQKGYLKFQITYLP